ncbi:uncharacterized protein LOC131946053 [Physella acuta]|uniref:uncharacterized protein LOC131946053 n=1 Tax=Physella acuta TaxID=109671 RepID=UPI0027DD7F1A|nr:uncharacterized protein LOC131946053 [Physella acuta]
MALESTKQKTEDSLQELKQWRDNFVKEQDNNADELNTQIESLKESNSNKPLDELCLDIEEIEIICHSISKEMQVHSDKTSSLKQEIKNHYDWISNLHEEAKKNTSITSKKIEDLFLKFETIDNVVWKLSNKVNTMETCLHRRYVCYMELDVTTPFNDGSICSTFRYVRESNGRNFDQTTGKFVSPHDGLYLVCVDLHESENKPIRMDVFVAKQCRSRIGINIGYTRATACVVVDMCTDEDLYFKLFSPVEDANLTPYSNITIVSL